jgi:hypothetical protein
MDRFFISATNDLNLLKDYQLIRILALLTFEKILWGFAPINVETEPGLNDSEPGMVIPTRYSYAKVIPIPLQVPSYFFDHAKKTKLVAITIIHTTTP